MSVASAVAALSAKIQNAYSAIQEKGGTLPNVLNAGNLSAAIAGIPAGGGALTGYTLTVSGGSYPIPVVLSDGTTTSVQANQTCANVVAI